MNPAETANQVIYISDFATSQVELLEAIERISGQQWTVKSVASETIIAREKHNFDAGNNMAVYKLIEMGFVTGKYGGWLEEKEKIWNGVLKLPRNTLDDVVSEALKSVEVK